MEDQLIISINREFGSGGHAIAEQIAKDLDLPVYDRNMLDHIAEEKGIKAEHYEGFDEKPRIPLISRTVRGHSNSVEEHLAELQFEYLKKKADSGESFVVVGRCSETVLQDNENLISIFVLADRNCKVERVCEKYHLSVGEAVSKMNRHDRHRKYYHNSYSPYRWGDSRGYDLCINSSRLGLEGTVAMLEHYIRTRHESGK